jgi:hypothetical protein
VKFVGRNLRTSRLRRRGPERLGTKQLTALGEGLTTIVEADLTLYGDRVHDKLSATSSSSTGAANATSPTLPA